MYIYTFLLGMTDVMTSQKIDFSSWDTLYKQEAPAKPRFISLCTLFISRTNEHTSVNYNTKEEAHNKICAKLIGFWFIQFLL
jgi:hypothetical protein